MRHVTTTGAFYQHTLRPEVTEVMTYTPQFAALGTRGLPGQTEHILSADMTKL